MVLDTNVLILFSKGDKRVVDTLLRVSEPLLISRITYMEFLADIRLTEEESKQAKQFLTGQFSIIDVGEEVADAGIAIRKQSSFKLPDALIIATARVWKQKLFTLDARMRKMFPEITISR